MKLKNFSYKRNLTSYAGVQSIITSVFRGNPIFIKRKRIDTLKLLNVGCGPNVNKSFINLDYAWAPEIDICWDICKPYPIKSSSLQGIYTEHCLEHISYDDFEKNMKEFFRMLEPGGNVRIIMPDGEIYMDIYQKRKRGEVIKMPFEEEYITPMARINGVFRNHGHLFIYDFDTVKMILEKTGFKNIAKASYLQGRDKRLLIDTEWRAIESLYVEASK